MKRAIFLAVSLAFTLVGCKSATTTAPSNDPNDPNKVRKLTVNSPGDQSVRVNGTDELSVSIDRKNVDGPVAVELRNLPPGVEVVTQDMTIPAGKDKIHVTLRAKPEAKPVKDHKVNVVAMPKDEKDMKEVMIDFKLEVKPKE